ncbi:MAG: hypothetical protein RL685_478 [Pseudomonadota bacterium]|jgi:hypothetical protein
MRADANRIAFAAAKAILAAAQGIKLQVDGKEVTCSVTKLPAPEWPDIELPGLESGRDGPWPAPSDIDCRWDGGSAALRLTLDHWARNTYRGLVGLRLLVRPGNRSLVWSTLATVIGDAKDGESISVPGWCNMFKPTQHVGSTSKDAGNALQRALRDLASKAGIPLLSASRVQLFQLELPGGEVRPSPDAAFRHVLQLALLKLDFLDRGPRAKARGTPLIELRRYLPAETTPPPPEDESEGDEGDEDDDSQPISGPRPRPPLNLILYGPPGTGKTYHLLTQLTPAFLRTSNERERSPDADSAETIASLPWWQVIALALHDLGGRSEVETLVSHRWLKVKHAAQGIPTKLSPIIWGQLQQHTVETSNVVKYARRTGVLLFDRGEDGNWFFAEPLPDELKQLGRELSGGRAQSEQRNYDMVTFHQSYSYEDFIEGIRPRLVANDEGSQDVAYKLEEGVFLRAVRAALRLAQFDGSLDEFCKLDRDERARLLEEAPPYALFIDEINRGNVARVFGELITLLEEDKRLGAENEVIVTLPYSRTAFGVPSNLHVIGTMNTADRSVEALDTALRRRFCFQEVPPQPELLDFLIEGDVDPRKMLTTINFRLEKLRDRDHCIGQAYLLRLAKEPTLQALKRVFRNAILPLLQEYFFGDWGKIGLVLGRDFVRRREAAPVDLADFPHDERDALNERVTYELVAVEQLTNKSFQRIYQHVPEDA